MAPKKDNRCVSAYQDAAKPLMSQLSDRELKSLNKSSQTFKKLHIVFQADEARVGAKDAGTSAANKRESNKWGRALRAAHNERKDDGVLMFQDTSANHSAMTPALAIHKAVYQAPGGAGHALHRAAAAQPHRKVGVLRSGTACMAAVEISNSGSAPCPPRPPTGSAARVPSGMAPGARDPQGGVRAHVAPGQVLVD
jgi:hypothetical protein